MALGRLPEGPGQLWAEGLGRGLVYSVAIVLLSLLCGFRAKYERAHHARGTPSTVDEAQGRAWQPGAPSPAHDLAGRLNHVSETARPAHRLAAGDLAAVGIDGEAPFVSRIHRIKEGANFPFLQNPASSRLTAARMVYQS